MIKYLGSKRLLIPDLLEHIGGDGVKVVADVFSGTSRVGHALKQAGYTVKANDLTAYAKTLADCYVVADQGAYAEDATQIIQEINNSTRRRAGWFTESFCQDAMFFQPKNGQRIDWAREYIEGLGLEPILKSVLLTSLMEAADRVDNTCGVQMAYLKKWCKRSYSDLCLRVPEMAPKVDAPCESYQLDALEFASQVTADVAYLDPPYNQHSYLGNYHIWESLVLWDQPELYGKARKRVDVKERKSDFNKKNEAVRAFTETVSAFKGVSKLVVSFSDEGFISRAEMESILSSLGVVKTISKDHPRYIGAQIGIHNLDGEKVGSVSHLRNTEYIYVVDITTEGKSNGI